MARQSKTKAPVIDMDQVTLKYGRAYKSAERASERKAKAQTAFFHAIDGLLESHVRSNRLVEFDQPDIDPAEFVKTYYPGHRLIERRDDQLLIEEDPSMMKFSYVNRIDGTVYTRTVSQTKPSLDDERLRAENPELWERITQWPEPWSSLCIGFARFVGFDLDDETYYAYLDTYMRKRGLVRVLKETEEWTDSDLSQASKYLVPGPMSVRVVKPRKAKEEDLES